MRISENDLTERHSTGIAYPEVKTFDLASFIGLLLDRKIFLAACAFFGLVISALYLHVATFNYTTTLQVVPTQSENSGAAGALGDIAGVASLAGVSIQNGQTASLFTLYQEGLTSRETAEDLAKVPDIMQTIFGDNWDANTKSWVQPSGILVSMLRGLKNILGAPNYPWHAPDAADLQKFLKESLGIQEDTKKSIVTVTFSYDDPAFSKLLVTKLHEVNDERLRERALARSDRYIDYLEKKLAVVKVAEHRIALARILAEQERTAMMASAEGVAFAAEPFGEVTVSPRATSPIPTLTLFIGLVGGLTIGIIILYAWSHPLRRQILGHPKTS